MKILILWSCLSDYMISCHRALASKPGVELHIVYQPIKSSAPYDPFDLSFYSSATKDTEKDKSGLVNKCVNLMPDAIIMASWNFAHYMKISKNCKKFGTYVISTFDGQWEGTLKQKIGVASSGVFLKPSIDNFLVPGDRQSNFARRLGYKNPLNGLYCANTSRFPEIRVNRPRKFLFVGRLVEIKGVRELIRAYEIYREKTEDPWDLIIAGVGPLQDEFVNKPGIDLRGFVQPEGLSVLFSEATCFVLPSLREPWGLVVHEAAIAGLIIICSHKVGASTWFVRDGQNGKVITPDDDSIAEALINISNSNSDKLKTMSVTSRNLGELWTTEKWADYLFDYIKSQLS